MAYDIDNVFKYHKAGPQQEYSYTSIREKAKEMAHVILENAPESRERSLALTKLEEAAMWANAAVARHGV